MTADLFGEEEKRRYLAAEYFGRDGLLSKSYDAFEYRKQQEEMSQVVGDAIRNESRVIVEAGTGTGKTLAYLMPIVAQGSTAIISTATKALQEQIVQSDIPKLRELGFNPDVCLLKGLNNYVCRSKFSKKLKNPPAWSRENPDLWASVKDWISNPESGYRDVANFPSLGDNAREWRSLTSSSQDCWGRQCEHYDMCWGKNARRDAQRAQIIVVNHYLFFADLMLKTEGAPGILPVVDFAILDEAHRIEDAATGFFSKRVSPFRVSYLAREIRRSLSTLPRSVQVRLDVLDRKTDDFFRGLERFLKRHDLRGSVRWRFAEEFDDYPIWATLEELAEDALTDIKSRHVPEGKSSVDIKAVLKRKTRNLRDDWFLFFQGEADEEEEDEDRMKHVRYIDLSGNRPALIASPINPGDVLEQAMLPVYPGMLFTSATLAAGENFDYFRSRSGLEKPESADEHIFCSPFDYHQQAATYVPESSQLVKPNHREYIKRAATIIEDLVEVTGGRAFVLCTSYRNMQAFFDTLKNRLDFPLLVQGWFSKSETIKRFKEKPSVLFATSSFWEGVDVPGEALKLVIMDKIPFAPFKDPLIEARLSDVKKRGGNPFMDFQVPQAAIALKQGFGRLVRRRTDWGIVSILDIRMMTGRYKNRLWAALPHCVDCASVEEVGWWYEDTQSEMGAGR